MELPPFFQERFSFLTKLPFKYRPWLSSVAATLAGVVVAAAYFQSGAKGSDYANAENVFVKWEASPQNELLFEEMKKALHKVPALEKKYEAAIIQKLIEVGKGVDALEMARHSLKTIGQEAPFHAAFAETSLLIEGKVYQEALEKSVGLKEKMAKEWDLERLSRDEGVGGSLLYAHNLLRIACLHQELKNKPGEKAAWEELEAYLKLHEESSIGALILNNFQDKGIRLSDYIAARKKQLH
jgi:hypothetical protein